MIRAFLLARATAALFLPRRATSDCSHRLRRSVFALNPADHRSRTMDEERSYILVPPLADPKQYRFIPRGMLTGHQTNTGGKLPAIAELLAITIGGHHRRGALRPNACYGAEPLADLIGRMLTLNLLVVLLDAFIQRAEGFQQLGKPAPKSIRKTVFSIFQDLRDPGADLADPLGHHDPVLTEQPADLIGQRRTLLDHRLTDPVQALEVLLLNAP